MDFHDSILTLAFPEDLNATLLSVYRTISPTRIHNAQAYLENRDEIRRILDEISVKLPTYENLEWRADAQVRVWFILFSITCSVDCSPLPETADRPRRAIEADSAQLGFGGCVICVLWSDGYEEQESVLLQTDPVSLQHMIQQLESALREAHSSHARRIMRNIK
jgi:hypothetical protein